LKQHQRTGFVTVAGIAAIVLILLLLFINRPPIIAFYGIPQNVQNTIINAAINGQASKKAKFQFQVLNPNKSLASQITPKTKIALLFVYDGKAAADTVKFATAPDEQVRSLMPSTMRMAGTVNGVAYGLPLLLDHFELAYNMKKLAQSGINVPMTLEEFKAAAKELKKHTISPIVCAGAQDADLLMLVGALTDAIGGPKAWKSMTDEMKKGKTFSELVRKTPLGSTLQELVEWRKEGLLHPEWFRMTNKDTIKFMENDYSGFVLMSFSTHRSIPLATIQKFDSLAFPGAATLKDRSFTAPILLGILLNPKRVNHPSRDFLYSLAKAEGQKEIAAQTGLAPVNATAETLDKQASDLRFWIAASDRPVPDPASASFDSPKLYGDFAKNVRQYIEADGSGY